MKKILLIVFIIIPGVAYSQILTVDQFIKKDIEIFHVKSDLNILTISGFDTNGLIKTERVALEQGEVLGIWTTSIMPQLSIITIPFKVRTKQNSFSQSVTTGLTNAGMNLGVFNLDLDRYFVSGSKSSHNFALGFLVAPTGEELKPENTNSFVSTTSKQLFISTGISLTYTFNDIAISAIPFGWDYATTTEGKNWIYNKKRWWGFGLGISTKILGL